MFGWFDEPFWGYSWPMSRGHNRLLALIRKLDEEEEKIPEKEPKTNSFSSENTIVSCDGERYEEHRERICDTEGVTHETTTRRIGDKWVRIEEDIRPDGKKSIKETWHNVSADKVADFKAKWEEKRGKFGFEHLQLTNETHAPKPVKHEPKKSHK